MFSLTILSGNKITVANSVSIMVDIPIIYFIPTILAGVTVAD